MVLGVQTCYVCMRGLAVALRPLCSILLPIHCNRVRLPPEGGGCEVAAAVGVYPH